MANLEILEIQDNRLRTIAKPVQAFDEELGRLIKDMTETMYTAKGIGLAAPVRPGRTDGRSVEHRARSSLVPCRGCL